MHSSKAMATSDPSSRWILMDSTGPRKSRVPSIVGGELDPVGADLAQRRQAEDLVAAAVGEHGPFPGAELVQPARLGDQRGAGAQAKVVGVAQDDLGPPGRPARAGVMVLTVARVPTGMNTGVCTSPWGGAQNPAPGAAALHFLQDAETHRHFSL